MESLGYLGQSRIIIFCNLAVLLVVIDSNALRYIAPLFMSEVLS
jgi:hypothetical protein